MLWNLSVNRIPVLRNPICLMEEGIHLTEQMFSYLKVQGGVLGGRNPKPDLQDCNLLRAARQHHIGIVLGSSNEVSAMSCGLTGVYSELIVSLIEKL